MRLWESVFEYLQLLVREGGACSSMLPSRWTIMYLKYYICKKKWCVKLYFQKASRFVYEISWIWQGICKKKTSFGALSVSNRCVKLKLALFCITKHNQWNLPIDISPMTNPMCKSLKDHCMTMRNTDLPPDFDTLVWNKFCEFHFYDTTRETRWLLVSCTRSYTRFCLVHEEKRKTEREGTHDRGPLPSLNSCKYFS